MINEEDRSFIECYGTTSKTLYSNEFFLEDLAGLAGVIKAVVEVSEEYNFDKDDFKELVERYLQEIYGQTF